MQVVEALKKLAGAGHTIVAAIHQPRSRIFELFDDLLLLSQVRATKRQIVVCLSCSMSSCACSVACLAAALFAAPVCNL